MQEVSRAMVEPWSWVPVFAAVYITLVLVITHAPILGIAHMVLSRARDAHWTERARRAYPWRVAAFVAFLGSVIAADGFAGNREPFLDAHAVALVPLVTMVASLALLVRHARPPRPKASWWRLSQRMAIAATLGYPRFWALPLTVAAGVTFEPRVSVVVDALSVLVLLVWSLAVPAIARRAEELAAPAWARAVEAAGARLGMRDATGGVLDFGGAGPIAWPRHHVTASPDLLAELGGDPIALEGAALVSLALARSHVSHRVRMATVTVGLGVLGAAPALAEQFGGPERAMSLIGIGLVYMAFVLGLAGSSRAIRETREIAPREVLRFLHRFRELTGTPLPVRGITSYDDLVAADGEQRFPRPGRPEWSAPVLVAIATVAACTFALPRGVVLLGAAMPRSTAVVLGESSGALAAADRAQGPCAHRDALWLTYLAAEREPWPETRAHARLVTAYVDAHDCNGAQRARTYLMRMIESGAESWPADTAAATEAIHRCDP